MVDIVPTLPIFHCVEVNDIEYFVSRGYVFVHTDSRGTGHSPRGGVGLLEPGRADRPLRHDRVDRRPGLVHRQGRHAGRVAAGLGAVVRRLPAAAAPRLHPALGRRRRHVPRRRLARRHDGRRASPRRGTCGRSAATTGSASRRASAPSRRTPTRGAGTSSGTSSTTRRATTSGSCAAPTSRRSRCRCSRSARCTRWGCTCAASCAATKRCRTPKKMMLIHGVMDGDEMAIYNSPEMRLLMLRWYDHWLKDNDTGFMDEPPVSIYVRGADEYRLEADWPIPRTEYRKLYFHPGPSTSIHESLNDGRLAWQPPAADGQLVHLLISRRGLDALLRRRHGAHRGRRRALHASHPHVRERAARGGPRGVGQHRPRALRRPRDQTNTDFFCRLVDQLPDDEQVPGLPPRATSSRAAGSKPRTPRRRARSSSKPTGRTTCTTRRSTSSPAWFTGSRSRCGRRATCSRRAIASAWTWPAATRRRSTSAAITTASRSAATPTTTRRTHPSHIVLPVIPRPADRRRARGQHTPRRAVDAAGAPGAGGRRPRPDGARAWSTCRTRSCRRAACSTTPGWPIDGAQAVIARRRRLLDGVRAAGVARRLREDELQRGPVQRRRPGLPELAQGDRHGAHAPATGDWGTYITEGTWDEQVVDELAPVAGEPVVRKQRYSGFAGTEPRPRAQDDRAPSTCCSSAAPPTSAWQSTLMDAFFLDYWPILVEDACFSQCPPSPSRARSGTSRTCSAG